jgi:hypothetical protein
MDSRFEELYQELMEVEVDKSGSPIFYWRLDEEYCVRWEDSLVYYKDRWDLLRREALSHLNELDELERRFLETEDYERCSTIRDLREKLKSDYAAWC